MIEISFGKLVLLALVALIVLGPEKLPHAARTAGALLRRVRLGWDSVRAEVERELQVEEIKRQAREAAERAQAAQSELDATLRKVRDAGAETVGTATVTSAPVTPAASVPEPGTQNPVAGETPAPAPETPPKDPTHGGA